MYHCFLLSCRSRYKYHYPDKSHLVYIHNYLYHYQDSVYAVLHTNPFSSKYEISVWRSSYRSLMSLRLKISGSGNTKSCNFRIRELKSPSSSTEAHCYRTAATLLQFHQTGFLLHIQNQLTLKFTTPTPLVLYASPDVTIP